jgi:hypothetical protein
MLFHKHHLESLERLVKGFESELIHVHVYGTQIIQRIAYVETNVIQDLHIFERINQHMLQEEHVLKRYLAMSSEKNDWLETYIPQLMRDLQQLETLCLQYVDDIKKLKARREQGLQEVRHHGRFSVTRQIVALLETITSLSKTLANTIKEEQERLIKEQKVIEQELIQEREIEHNIESWLL